MTDRHSPDGGAGRPPDEPRNVSLRDQFDSADLHRHLALFYRTEREQLAVASIFVELGLRRGERCLYLADQHSTDRIERHFRAAGIDVDARKRAGDLLVLEAADVYLDDGFSPEKQVETLREITEESLEAGYAGVRAAGENTWSLDLDERFPQVLEFEAEFDRCCPDAGVTALCQYDLDAFSDETIANVLRTHKQLVYRETLCTNPYYVPPSEYLDSDGFETDGALMLDQIYDLAQSKREIQAREQRLSVVNRVLRHNIRNDMTVVLGHLDRLAERGDLSDDARSDLAVAREVATALVDLSEKARYVDETLGGGAVRPTDLVAALERARSAVGSDRPDVTFEYEGPDERTVLADERLETVFVELFESTVAHSETASPTIAVRVRPDAPTDSVRVDVVGDGSPFSSSERRALSAGAETPLQHSNGLGLWIAKWIVESVHGTVSFGDGEDGPQVSVTLPAADADDS